MQQKDVVTPTERRCRTVNEKSPRLGGYDVTYRLEGKEGVARMAHSLGARIPVKDGHLVLFAPPAK
jgi:uncharacterized protein YcfJ